MTGLTEAFTRHALSLRWEAVPEPAKTAARAFFLDTLSVGIAGRRAWLADAVLNVARQWGEAGAQGPAASIFGLEDAPRLPVASAAFVNGFQIHCQEYDCVHEPAVVHPMAVIGAALIAETEARPVAGAECLAALVAGVDVAAGLGVAVSSPIRFFRPANAGLFGAVLGIARLRGFDETRALDALGYALAQAAGTMQAHVEGKPALPLQIAGAARAAIVACDLAEAGVPGPHDVFEGPYGYLPLFEEQWDVRPVIADLGRVFRIAEVSYKPFPTGRAAQGGIVLMQRLKAAGLAPDAVRRITLSAPPLIKRLVGRPAHQAMQVNYARLCFGYLGARALLSGAVALEDFSDAALRDPTVLALADKIAVVEDGGTDPAAFTPQTLTAELADGAVMTERAEALYGAPAEPMREGDVAAKRAACLAFGFGRPRPDVDEALQAAIAGLERGGAQRLGPLAAGRLSI